ncbi:hypothetical protein DRJ17_07215 [Candidatus Woesearchaeota archaeon]|nr:MAG: hypothetical protein DRJ17_07215 [Candidatus Woesearchaeota archaeon]
MADISRLESCVNPAGFQWIAVTSLAIAVNAPPMPAGRAPTPTLRKAAPVLPEANASFNV